MYANVLVGLAMVLQDKNAGDTFSDALKMKVEERIEATCRALAPFMLSITFLGQENLSEGDHVDGLEAALG